MSDFLKVQNSSDTVIVFDVENKVGVKNSGTGVAPAGLIVGSFSAGPESSRIQSNEIRRGRRPGRSVPGGITLDDTYTTDYIPGVHDKLILMAMATNGGVFKEISMTASTISVDEDAKTIADSGNGFISAGFKAGMAFKMSGWGASYSNNNGFFIIKTLTAGLITLTDDAVLDTAAAGSAITLYTKYATCGTKQMSASFDHRLLSVPHFLVTTGAHISKFSMTFAPEAIPSIEFSTTGLSFEKNNDGSWGPAGYKTVAAAAAGVSGISVTGGTNDYLADDSFMLSADDDQNEYTVTAVHETENVASATDVSFVKAAGEAKAYLSSSVTDLSGFFPGQSITIANSTTSANDGNYIVATASATKLEVETDFNTEESFASETTIAGAAGISFEPALQKSAAADEAIYSWRNYANNSDKSLTVDFMAAIYKNGQKFEVSEVSIDFDANTSGSKTLGSRTPTRISQKSFNPTGQLTYYLCKAQSMLDDLLDGNTFSVMVKAESLDNKIGYFYFPSAEADLQKFSGSKEDDIMHTVPISKFSADNDFYSPLVYFSLS